MSTTNDGDGNDGDCDDGDNNDDDGDDNYCDGWMKDTSCGENPESWRE